MSDHLGTEGFALVNTIETVEHHPRAAGRYRHCFLYVLNWLMHILSLSTDGDGVSVQIVADDFSAECSNPLEPGNSTECIRYTNAWLRRLPYRYPRRAGERRHAEGNEWVENGV